MGYKVEIDVFEGPYDLLVYLIENSEMSIYDIQITEITEKYINYLEQMKEMHVEIASEFMILSATLLQIKSKMLLPNKKLDNENTIEEDPRDELVATLLEYTKYKKVAEIFQKKNENVSLQIAKPKEDVTPYTKEVDYYLTMDMKNFVNAFNLFLKKKQRVEEVRKNYTRIRKHRETVENKIMAVVDFIKSRNLRKIFFRELTDIENNREDSVLTFTAILQMMKSKIVSAEQKYNFGEIEIEVLGDDK